MLENTQDVKVLTPAELEELTVVPSAVKVAGGRSGRSNRNREKTQQHMASIDGVSIDDALKNVCFTANCA